MAQAKNYQPGKTSSPTYGGGLKKPTYTGADRAKSAPASNQAAPYRQGKGGGAGGGGAKASGKGVPGAGPMASGSARGALSYPTRNSAVRHTGAHKNTLKSSGLR